ncbi:MAG: ribulose-phosphate 3-epimerase [Desulfovibrio sp.]|nr:MAG: ribulose-phosphate 3-epimerase [Desulfovibrio sp.]
MSNPVILSPSLLSSDFGRLAEELAALEAAGLKWVHWDVMDGHFVPNITFGPPVIKSLRERSKLFFDVHLMIEKPERYLAEFVDAGADMLGVHAEASVHLERTVSEIKRLGAKACVTLNPHTPLSMVEYLLPDLDMVLIMSVNPGFGGQKFLDFTMDKIEQLAAMKAGVNPSMHIQVDGGVTPDNIAELTRRGADVFVSGSAFFNYPPYDQRLKTFMDAAQD